MKIMAAKVSFMSFWVMVLAHSLMLSVPGVSAASISAPGDGFGESFSRSDPKWRKSTLSFPTMKFSPTQEDLKCLEKSIECLQTTIRSIFFPMFNLPGPLNVRSFDPHLIEATSNATREALSFSIESLRSTLQTIFFPFLNLPANFQSLNNFTESVTDAEIRKLENGIRSAECLLQSIFYPFLDSPQGLERSVDLLKRENFQIFERSIRSMYSALKFIFYPFLRIPALQNVSGLADSALEAELQIIQFSVRSVEEILKVLFLPARLAPQALRKTAEFKQEITFKTLEQSNHALHSTLQFAFSPFLKFPSYLQPLDSNASGGDSNAFKSTDLSIQSLQRTLKHVFFPFLNLPDPALSFGRSLNETGLANPLEAVMKCMASLESELLRPFFPFVPQPSPKSLPNSVEYVVNVLSSLDDTLKRVLFTYVNSVPPSSSLPYLWNDLVSLENTVQYILFPFTTGPLASLPPLPKIGGSS